MEVVCGVWGGAVCWPAVPRKSRSPAPPPSLPSSLTHTLTLSHLLDPKRGRHPRQRARVVLLGHVVQDEVRGGRLPPSRRGGGGQTGAAQRARRRRLRCAGGSGSRVRRGGRAGQAAGRAGRRGRRVVRRGGGGGGGGGARHWRGQPTGTGAGEARVRVGGGAVWEGDELRKRESSSCFSLFTIPSTFPPASSLLDVPAPPPHTHYHAYSSCHQLGCLFCGRCGGRPSQTSGECVVGLAASPRHPLLLALTPTASAPPARTGRAVGAHDVGRVVFVSAPICFCTAEGRDPCSLSLLRAPAHNVLSGLSLSHTADS